jgi:NAD(P)-dependent dehydrogenase (short-subunit alcohol dehydrogenase family)
MPGAEKKAPIRETVLPGTTTLRGTTSSVAAGKRKYPRKDLSGRIALVTGGGRGIGRAFALALAAYGATVVVAARSADQLACTVALIAEAGGRATAVPLDITNHTAVVQAIEHITGTLGPIDLLVNNAGMWGPIAPVWEADPEQWWQTIDTNLRGGFLCTHTVLPSMLARRSGRIINITSGAGSHSSPEASAYSVSKAAIIKFTENLAAETKGRGIAVFALHPGIVSVGLTETALAIQAPADSPAGRAAAAIRRDVAEGRVVPPEVPADLIIRLASGDADVLSGCYLAVDYDLDVLIARGRVIQEEDFYTLRVRTPGGMRAYARYLWSSLAGRRRRSV